MSNPESEPESESDPNQKSKSKSNYDKSYHIACHSVRISKFGYAVDPLELSHREVIRNIPAIERRNSHVSFDSEQIGHKILDIIRGFWSQAAFPDGQLMTKSRNVAEVMAEFSKIPFYPHTTSLARMSMLASNRNPRITATSDKSGSKRNRPGKSGLVRIDVGSHWPDTKSAKDPIPSTKTSSPSISSDLSQDIKEKFRTFSGSSLSQQPANSSTTPKSPSVSSGNKSQTTAKGLFSLFANKSKGSLGHQPASESDVYLSWIPQDKKSMFDVVADLCRSMETIFDKEERIISIKSPCLVMGDIHGNLNDLRTYERSLWPKAPLCCSKNHLFLGDYVDRGEFSIECVLYLFAMKSISPNRFFMLRGNHEVAIIQKQYTFGRECEVKFGPQLGKRLWRIFNRVFDVMPLAAIIDEKIFCAHGGIPRTITDIETLRTKIPRPLDNPETQCPSAWEILWNDPITDQELVGMIEMDNAQVTQAQNLVIPQAEMRQNSADAILSREQQPTATSLSSLIHADDTPDSTTSGPSLKQIITKAMLHDQDSDGGGPLRTVPSDTSSIASASPQQIINDGFVSNIKRGTAYLFSDQAIENFLKTNKLSHVIRAHEVIPTGFAFHGDGRVMTIFSSSKYCGLNNQAACALVTNERIRILRLETSNSSE